MTNKYFIMGMLTIIFAVVISTVTDQVTTAQFFTTFSALAFFTYINDTTPKS